MVKVVQWTWPKLFLENKNDCHALLMPVVFREVTSVCYQCVTSVCCTTFYGKAILDPLLAIVTYFIG